jgi:hypothetical protein
MPASALILFFTADEIECARLQLVQFTPPPKRVGAAMGNPCFGWPKLQ